MRMNIFLYTLNLVHITLLRYCYECISDTSEVIEAGENLKLTKKNARKVSSISLKIKQTTYLHKVKLCICFIAV